MSTPGWKKILTMLMPVGVGLDVLDVVDGGGQRALEQGRHAARHLVRRQARVLPGDGDHGHFDVGEDVGGRAHRGQRADDQQRERQHDEGIGTPQRDADQAKQHVTHALDWFAKGYVDWLRMLLDGERDPYARFAARYRAALDALPLFRMEVTEAHLRSEWRHFIAGTYGLCTRTGLPEDIAAKELAIRAIRNLTDDGRPLDAAERERLARARELLDRASSLFAPHERARSSRARYGLK
jgi:hypothetical protein